MLHATTCVHVEVFLIIASSHVRTEPQSVIGHTGGKKNPICLKSLSYNTGAESVSNKLFTTTHPLCLFVEILTCLASTTGIELDVSHIPGADNVIADDLSRWDFSTPIPHDFQPGERIQLSLSQLWHCSPYPTLHPPDSKLLWKLPLNFTQ